MRINMDDPELDWGTQTAFRGQWFTGELVESVPGGGRATSVTGYRDGLEHGPSTEWYATGELRATGAARRGRAVGPQREWHRNGRLCNERIFDDDGNRLAERYWDEDGNLIEERGPAIPRVDPDS